LLLVSAVSNCLTSIFPKFEPTNECGIPIGVRLPGWPIGYV